MIYDLDDLTPEAMDAIDATQVADAIENVAHNNKNLCHAYACSGCRTITIGVDSDVGRVENAIPCWNPACSDIATHTGYPPRRPTSPDGIHPAHRSAWKGPIHYEFFRPRVDTELDTYRAEAISKAHAQVEAFGAYYEHISDWLMETIYHREAAWLMRGGLAYRRLPTDRAGIPIPYPHTATAAQSQPPPPTTDNDDEGALWNPPKEPGS